VYVTNTYGREGEWLDKFNQPADNYFRVVSIETILPTFTEVDEGNFCPGGYTFANGELPVRWRMVLGIYYRGNSAVDCVIYKKNGTNWVAAVGPANPDGSWYHSGYGETSRAQGGNTEFYLSNARWLLLCKLKSN
jgi:hypothetical protein